MATLATTMAITGSTTTLATTDSTTTTAMDTTDSTRFQSCQILLQQQENLSIYLHMLFLFMNKKTMMSILSTHFRHILHTTTFYWLPL